jgi:hypothetical protein
LYLALLAGQVLFCLVVVVLVNSGQGPGEAGAYGDLLKTVAPLMLIAALGGAYFLTKKRKQEGALLPGINEKAAHYRALVITRSGLLEGANLVVLVAMLLENDTATYLPYFVIGILAFLYFRPSVNRFITEYEIPEREAQVLKKEL